MDSLKQFSDYYKTITNAELLDILENPNDYQPLALEAAKIEFGNRNLSDTEMAEAKEFLIEMKFEEWSKKEKRKDFENKTKLIALDFAEIARPTNIPIRSTDKIIKSISLVYAIIFISNVINEWRYTFRYAKRFRIENIIYLEPLLVLLLATFFFWQKVSVGWRLLMLYAVYTLAGNLWAIASVFKYYFGQSSFVGYAKNFIVTLIFQFLLFGGTILIICRQDIREVFKIDKKRMISSIAFSIILSLLIWLFL